ncbi:MAG: UDP-N-acetylmuramoyl-tripeptide--D-alanyl-D-alanine ligase, partial [bacterium]
MPLFSGSELEKWTGGRWEPSCPQHLNGVSTDTRTLVSGNLYIALRGKTMDGSSFVAQAAAKGAAGAVVPVDYPSRGTASCPLLRVGDTLAAMQSAAVSYRRSLGVEVVGVTGSAGKTTVKEMIADILSEIKPVARTMGNFNNEIGVPMSLLAMERDARIGVFEVGTNHPGELAPLCAMIEPQWGVITNIGPVHLEFFGSIDGVVAEKSSLLKALPADGSAVLCRDDASYTTLKSLVQGRVVDVSMRSGAEISFAGMTTSGQEVRIVEKSSGAEFCFRPSVPGDHNICNAMMAIAVGRGHGMGWQDIRRGIEKFVPQPMRWVQ